MKESEIKVYLSGKLIVGGYIKNKLAYNFFFTSKVLVTFTRMIENVKTVLRCIIA